MTRVTSILVAFLGITVALALIDTLWLPVSAGPGSFDFVASLSYAFCAFAWVKADAEARAIEAPRGAALLAALMIPVGVPVYLFRALGARRGAWATLKAFGFMAVLLAAYLVVSYAVGFVAYGA